MMRTVGDDTLWEECCKNKAKYQVGWLQPHCWLFDACASAMLLRWDAHHVSALCHRPVHLANRSTPVTRRPACAGLKLQRPAPPSDEQIFDATCVTLH